MPVDRRLLRVYFDHAQKRLKRGRIGFTARGFDFLEGELVGAWVNPITGVLQPIPNSEEPEFYTSNAGRFAKIQLAHVTVTDNNAPPQPRFKDFKPTDGLLGIRYTGKNDSGVGVKTTNEYPENTGWTDLVFDYGNGSGSGDVLLERGWSNSGSGVDGVSVRYYIDGRLEIWRNNKMQTRGSISGAGYQPGSVRGASYERASDEYVMIRTEVSRGRYLTITSSKGGVFQYACPWAIDHEVNGEPVEAEPVLPSAQCWWYVPKGGAAVVSAPVVYGFPNPYAISPVYRLAEVPGVGSAYVARTIQASGGTVALLKTDGVTAYVPNEQSCRIRVDVTDFVDGVSGAFPPIYEDMAEPPGGPIDVSEWLLSCDFSLEDGPMGFSARIVLRGEAPIPLLTEIEGRAVLFRLEANPDDPTNPAPLVLLDGVAGPPEYEDGLTPAHTRVAFTVFDRLQLVREAQVTETAVFDGLPLSRPVAAGESLVSICLQEGGIDPSEMDLIDLDYTIEDTPPQRAGEWNFSGEIGDLWSDVLERGLGMAPQIVWGLRPTPTGTRFYMVDPEASTTSVAILYRRPQDVPTPETTEIGAWYATYGDHRRVKLPREANVVRVTGYDPAADKIIQAYISDDDSRHPSAPQSDGKLGFTRQFGYADPALSTQEMVNKVCLNVWKAVARKAYVESWTSLLQFLQDGRPLWRGDVATLDGSNPDGTDGQPRVTAWNWSAIDESGQGLMDSIGVLAPVPLRPADYTGGAIVALGGSGLDEIRRRQSQQIEDGSLRRRGWGRIPRTSAAEVVALAIP